MRLSEERISHIAHLIVDGIWGDDIVDFKDEARVLKEVKAVMFDYLHMEDEADEHARDMIHSLKKRSTFHTE